MVPKCGRPVKLSISYNFFNGEEHLLASILSLRDGVEHISIVWQDQSNRGEPISEMARDVLSDIRSRRLVDDVIKYVPDLKLPRQVNELTKRKLGMRRARWRFCSHFFTIDADEFYRVSELQMARQVIAEGGFNSSSVESYMHLRRPVWRCKDSTNCAFITRLNLTTSLGEEDYPTPIVDPTRKMSIWRRRHRHFAASEVAMYHMNLVRTDLSQKLRNSSTTDQVFLDRVATNVAAWVPGTPFDFGPKGKFDFTQVPNEFGTFDPGR
jgi:hypothetical protein